MWSGRGIVAVFVLTLPVAAVSGCGEGCDPEVVERASKFVDAHQSCERNEDCVVVTDFCTQIPGGLCGQLPMNRAAATSAEWRSLDAELRDCGPNECAQCNALLVPSCTEGSCSRR